MGEVPAHQTTSRPSYHQCLLSSIQSLMRVFMLCKNQKCLQTPIPFQYAPIFVSWPLCHSVCDVGRHVRLCSRLKLPSNALCKQWVIRPGIAIQRRRQSKLIRRLESSRAPSRPSQKDIAVAVHCVELRAEIFQTRVVASSATGFGQEGLS